MKSIARNDIMTIRKFWTTIKRFLTNKRMIVSKEIVLKQGEDIVNDEVKVAEIPNNVYINVVENTIRKKPVNVVDLEDIKFSTPIDQLMKVVQINIFPEITDL